MGIFNDIVTTATGGVYSPDHGLSAPGLGLYTNTSYGQGVTGKNSSVASFIPGIGDKYAQERANEMNLAEARANRAFQERMSSTAYQRATADMKSSGLNPILAFMNGGASTPSGGAATVQPASATGLADFALKSMTGLGGLSQKATALQQQQSLNDSSIKLNNTNAAKNVQQAEQIRLDNIRKKKYEPLDDAAYKGIKQSEKIYNELMNGAWGNSAKSIQLDKSKDAQEIKEFRYNRVKKQLEPVHKPGPKY